MIYMNGGGSLVSIKRPYMNANGTIKQIDNVWMNANGTLVHIYPEYQISYSVPVTEDAFVVNNAYAYITSDDVLSLYVDYTGTGSGDGSNDDGIIRYYIYGDLVGKILSFEYKYSVTNYSSSAIATTVKYRDADRNDISYSVFSRTSSWTSFSHTIPTGTDHLAIGIVFNLDMSTTNRICDLQIRNLCIDDVQII